MRDKKWWKYLLPLIIAVKIVVVIMALSSLKADETSELKSDEVYFKSVKIPEKVTFAV